MILNQILKELSILFRKEIQARRIRILEYEDLQFTLQHLQYKFETLPFCLFLFYKTTQAIIPLVKITLFHHFQQQD